MSHFSVLACLPPGTELGKVNDLLADVMAPWDENTDVEPYRDYEDGGIEDFWFVSSMRTGAEHHRNGTGLKKHTPDMLGWSSESTKDTPDQQRAEFAEKAKWSERLGENPTWETVVTLHNERYSENESQPLSYDPEMGRAYTMSTYNPESKWDYWRVGGRWSGYFTAKPGSMVIPSEKHWDSPKDSAGEGRCDGGAIKDLDLATLRAGAAGDAEIRYQQWEELAKSNPPAKSWAHFRDLAELGEITWRRARTEYGVQPLIKAADTANFSSYSGCIVQEFTTTKTEYVATAAREAIPGYALVTLEREWVAPGRMGWFGMSSDGPGEKSAYKVGVNQYLDQLDPATVLVVLDCHI
jgi:hypothetical protein